MTILKQRNYAYEFHTKPGGHDWSEWDTQTPGCFESLIEREIPRQSRISVNLTGPSEWFPFCKAVR